MTSILRAESRVIEIAFVTPSKAPELLSTFVKACFDLARFYSELQLQHRLAERRSDKRRAVVLLEVVPATVSEKKLGSNAEIREAIVDTDIEYDASVTDAFEVEALLTLVKGKLQAMEEALHAVKKVLQDATPAFVRNNPDLVSPTLNTPNTPIVDWPPDVASNPPVARNAQQPTTTTTTYSIPVGKAKY
jgi:hypothetical protein